MRVLHSGRWLVQWSCCLIILLSLASDGFLQSPLQAFTGLTYVPDCHNTPVSATTTAYRSVDVLDLPWQVAGISQKQGSLIVQPTRLAIARGSSYLDDPLWNPENRFDFRGDFALAGTITIVQSLTLRLGKLPLTYDDFVAGRWSVALVISPDRLEVRAWDGVHTAPATSSYPLESGRSEKQFSLELTQGKLHTTIDGDSFDTALTVLPGNQVWLGLEGAGTVTRLRASSADGLSVGDMATLSTAPCNEGLRALVSQRRPGFELGAAVAAAPWVSDSRYAALLAGNFNSVTIENALKPQFTEPARGVFTLQEAKFLAQLAVREGLAIHGHALVPDRSLPAWMAGSAPHDRLAIMLGHIKGVVGGMGGLVSSWDVVNEPLAPDYAGLPWQSGWRTSIWYSALGASYIEAAFDAAHLANPHASLWINDYALDKDSLVDEARFQLLFNELVKLKAKGYDVGLGFEGHVYAAGRDAMSASALLHRLQQLDAAGIKARISEMDVTPLAATGTVTAASLNFQAGQFGSIVWACLQAANCVGFTMWGIGGPYVSTAGITDGRLAYTSYLPWDNDLLERPAYAALKKAILIA